jgi:sec-independent protein translocase protein TatB
MLGLSFGEILVVAMVALIVVGPDNLPRFARSAGRMYGQLRRMADELRRGLVLEADRQDAEDRLSALRERRQQAEAQRRAAEDASPGVQAQPDPWAPPPESAVDDELATLHDDPVGPYASGRRLDDVLDAWRDEPRVDTPALDFATGEPLPPGVSPEEWAELPPRIRALLRERAGGSP